MHDKNLVVVRIKIIHGNCWTNYLVPELQEGFSLSPVMRTLDASGATATDVLINGNTKAIREKLRASRLRPFSPIIMGQLTNGGKRGALFVKFKFRKENSIYKNILDNQVLYKDAYYENNTEIWRFLLQEKVARRNSSEIIDKLKEVGDIVKIDFLSPENIYDPYIMGFLNFQFSEKVVSTLKSLWEVGYFDFPRTNNTMESSQLLDVSKAYISKLSRMLQTKVLETLGRKG